MCKNKGFIGIGLIIAIILGIALVGGGAFYLGKSSEKKEVKIEENKNITTNTVTVPNNWKTYTNTSVGFEFKYPPEIIIDSDKYKYNEAALVGFRGNIEPSSGVGVDAENIDESAKKDIGGSNHFTVNSLEVDGQDARVVCTQETELCTVNIILPKPFKLGKYIDGSDRYFKFLVISGDIFFPQKYVNQILSTFKFINSASNNVSTVLPAKYLGAQNWPPIIKTSGFAYSCKISSGSGDVPTVVVEKIINGKKYCVTSFIDAGAGSRFGEYTYTTPSISGSGTKTTSFNLQWSSCGAYDKPESDQCQITVSTFLNNLDVTVDSLMFINL